MTPFHFLIETVFVFGIIIALAHLAKGFIRMFIYLMREIIQMLKISKNKHHELRN